jgi:hypothetical protein
MSPKFFYKTVAGSLFTLLMGCSSKPIEPSKSPPSPSVGASIEAKQVAAEQEATFVTEISFKKGNSRLSDSMKMKLQALIGDAARVGNIKAVHTISWADEEYPSSNAKKLSQKGQDLAKSRNEELEKFFETMPVKMKVIAHSMAERPGIFKDLWGDDEVRIKKSLEAAGIPTTDTAVKVPSKASKAIVFVILKSK